MGLSVRGLVFVLVLVWSTLAEQLVPKLGTFTHLIWFPGSDLLHRELGFAAAYSPIHKVKVQGQHEDRGECVCSDVRI